eukprot:m.898611 g.898611  ORF g.898611 m.898611 type:complete len:151 (-) comp23675_c0_seq3:1171-1623(-)
MCSIRETISLRTPHVFLYRSFEKHAQHFADCLRRLRWIGSTSVCTRRWLCDVVWQLVCVSCSLTPRGLQGHLSCGMQIAGLTLFNGFNGGTHFYTFEIAHAGQYTMYVYLPVYVMTPRLAGQGVCSPTPNPTCQTLLGRLCAHPSPRAIL